MPRFAISSSEEERQPQLRGFSAAAPKANKSSKKLSCLSADFRSVHLLHGDRIETHSLPLAGTTEESIARVPVISTPLPTLTDSTNVVELMCVNADSGTRPLPEIRNGIKYTVLSLLCLYTRHAVFLIQIGYDEEQDKEQAVIDGVVLSVEQPFLTELVSSQVVRVRPAPYFRLGYATFCPEKSIVALCRSSNGESHQLLVYHGDSNHVTQPLTFETEAVLEEPEFVDFCFAQSNAQSLLVTLSIHLIKSNGDVYGASPIFIDGSMVPTSVYHEAYELLSSQDNAQDAARDCLCRAALRFLEDAFHLQDDYMVVRLHGGAVKCGTSWPVQLQGPLVMGNGGGGAACCSEAFFARDLVGFAVAGAGGVQLCVTPPTTLLPRFIYEGLDFAAALNQQLLGTVVEHVMDLPCGALVRDPLLPTVLHCVSDRGVTTLTSYAMNRFSASMTLAPPIELPTKAWMSVDLPPDMSVHGAVVSGDAHLGHVMVVFLSTGELTAINLTETRVRYESTNALPVVPLRQPMDEALQSVEATPAFHEKLGPVVEKVENGLLKMSKLVGSSTHPKDLDAGLLATALAVRQRCEQDVVVHLKYLDKMGQIRLAELRKVVKGQLAQLHSIQDSLKQAKSKTKAVRERMIHLEEVSKSLVLRSSTVLQASRDLRPTLTDADREYFTLLQRMSNQCGDWENHVDQMHGATRNADWSGATNIELTPSDRSNIQVMLRGQNSLIEQIQVRVTGTASKVAELVDETGVVGDPYEGQ